MSYQSELEAELSDVIIGIERARSLAFENPAIYQFFLNNTHDPEKTDKYIRGMSMSEDADLVNCIYDSAHEYEFLIERKQFIEEELDKVRSE